MVKDSCPKVRQKQFFQISFSPSFVAFASLEGINTKSRIQLRHENINHRR